MNHRETEYRGLGLDARWLGKEHAKNAYLFAGRYSANDRYGLNEATVSNIRRIKIDSYSVAKEWVREHFGNAGTVQIVYGSEEVCVISATDFLNHWENIFVPCRDDAVVIHNLSQIILFYCHEQEIGIGVRNA